MGIGEEEPRVTIENTPAVRANDVHITLMSLFNTPNLRRPLHRIGDLLARGDLDIRVDRVYGLDEAEEAHRTLVADSFLGKRVFVPQEG